MSQEKVNQYKEQKNNRKEILKKEKAKKMRNKVIAGVIIIAIVGWVGYSVYDMVTAPDTSAVEIDTTALDEVLNSTEAE